ncbi:hypothetical protein VNI00_015689 [Paramarasmius palmivorus]|uniref:F-box domain-containing protein n=1 Tax=Paramarasmius palmivorus TaxID=297713 RepID=A0AAW0BIZ9_9AGAR
MQNNPPDNPQCFKCKNKTLPILSFASLSPSVLRMNLAPTNADIARTKAIMEEEEQELRRYDEEVQHARQVFARRKALRQNLVERRSWLAPIRKLPVEILDMIFAEVPNTSLNIGGLQSKRSERCRFGVEAVSLMLTHVSYHWREIVSAKCSMWSSIDWSCWTMKKDWTPLLNIYLKNAANEPLQIGISGSRADIPALTTVKDWTGTHDLHFLQTLARQFPRCVKLNIEHPRLHPMVLHHALNGLKFEDNVVFPCLQILSYDGDAAWPIRTSSNGITTLKHRFWDAIHHAPMLKEMDFVTIVQLTQLDTPHSVFPSWDQLTIVRVSYLESYTDFRTLITHCPQLEDLKVERPFGWDDGPTWDDVIEPVVLSHLHELDLKPKMPQDLHGMLVSLSLPSVKRLGIGLGDQEPGDTDSICLVLQSLSSMLQRSSSVLTSLRLIMRQWSLCERSWVWFSSVLRQSPSLEYLALVLGGEVESCVDVVQHDVTAQLCSLLSLSNDHRRVCLPRLKTLRLEVDTSDTPNHPDVNILGAVLDIVEERSSPHDPNAQPGRDDVSALRNIEIGMGVQVRRDQGVLAIEDRVTALGGNFDVCEYKDRFWVTITIGNVGWHNVADVS